MIGMKVGGQQDYKKMIKFELERFIKDHMWFGWYWTEECEMMYYDEWRAGWKFMPKERWIWRQPI